MHATAQERDDGRSLTMARGGRLEVRLPAQLGTGFGWQPPASRLFKVTPSVEPGPGPGMPGGPEMQVFVLSADRTGTETLVFEYRRPWEKDVAPSRRYRLEVSVIAE